MRRDKSYGRLSRMETWPVHHTYVRPYPTNRQRIVLSHTSHAWTAWNNNVNNFEGYIRISKKGKRSIKSTTRCVLVVFFVAAKVCSEMLDAFGSGDRWLLRLFRLFVFLLDISPDCWAMITECWRHNLAMFNVKKWAVFFIITHENQNMFNRWHAFLRYSNNGFLPSAEALRWILCNKGVTVAIGTLGVSL